MLIKNNITQYLKTALSSRKDKNLIFSYSKKIDLNNIWNDLLHHNKHIFHINYPNDSGYIGFGICKSYSTNSKKNIKNLINKNFKRQIYGNKKKISLKLFGGVAFDFHKTANTIWSDIPKSLFYLP